LEAPVSQHYLGTQGHEREAAAKLQDFIKQAVPEFFEKRNIPINAASLQINVSVSTIVRCCRLFHVIDQIVNP
jgi:deoxyribodipyrimidine photolyase